MELAFPAQWNNLHKRLSATPFKILTYFFFLLLLPGILSFTAAAWILNIVHFDACCGWHRGGGWLAQKCVACTTGMAH